MTSHQNPVLFLNHIINALATHLQAPILFMPQCNLATTLFSLGGQPIKFCHMQCRIMQCLADYDREASITTGPSMTSYGVWY